MELRALVAFSLLPLGLNLRFVVSIVSAVHAIRPWNILVGVPKRTCIPYYGITNP